MDNKSWRLRFPSKEPPEGWSFYEARTDITVPGQDLHSLVDKVIEHRIYKELLPTNPNIVRKEIEQQICERLNGDAGFCKIDRNG